MYPIQKSVLYYSENLPILEGMKCRFFAVTSVLFLTLFAPPIFAEGDNVVQENHFYIESNGGISFPLGFFSTEFKRYDLMTYGANFSAGMGLNFGGWMFGLEVTRDMWQESADQNNLLVTFNNNILMLRVQKVLNKATWNFLPRWLEFVPGLGVGVNFVNASFYTSTRAKDDDLISKIEFPDPEGLALVAKMSFEISLWFGRDWIIPYIGADYTVFLDSLAGISFVSFPRAYAGVRIYPGSIVRSIQEGGASRYKKSIGTWGPAVANVSVSPKTQFVPSSAKNGGLEIALSYEYLEYKSDRWQVEVLDEDGSVCKSWEGSGSVPGKITWDGSTDGGIPLISMQNYTIRFMLVPQEEDRTRNGQQMIGTQTKVTTGIVQNKESDSLFHIYLNLPEEDRDETFNALAKSLGQNAKASVTVYAETTQEAQQVWQEALSRGASAESVKILSSSSLKTQIEIIIQK